MEGRPCGCIWPLICRRKYVQLLRYLPTLYVKPTAESAAPTLPRVEIHDAILAAEGLLNGTHTGHPTETHYLATSNGHLALVHAIRIRNKNLGTSYEAFVDAHSGQLLSLTDFVSASRSCNQFTCSRADFRQQYTVHPSARRSYNQFTCSETDFRQQYTVLPTPGGAAPPDGFQDLTDPEDNAASPSIIDWPGWHSVSTTSTTRTEWVTLNILVYILNYKLLVSLKG